MAGHCAIQSKRHHCCEIPIDHQYRMYLLDDVSDQPISLPVHSTLVIQVVGGPLTLADGARRRTYLGKDGDLFLIQMGETPRRWTVTGSSMDSLKIVILAGDDGGFGVLGGRRPVFQVPRGFPALGAQILAASAVGGEAGRLYVRAKGMELAAMVLASGHEDGQGAHPSILERAQGVAQMLDHDLASPPTLNELARRFRTTVARLTGDFKAIHGMSIHRYVQEQRLHEAFRLLSQDGVQASVAAYRVGYSPAHFSTLFRQRYGVCPKDITARAR